MGAEARVGTISIGMRVGMGGLNKGLSDAGAKVSDFASKLATGVKVGLAALGVGAAVKGLNDLRAASAEAIDATGKLSDKLGASTENLIGLQHAGALAGVSNEVLDKSLTKLGVNLAQAKLKGTETDGVFKRLGLDAGQLASMDRVQAFGQIADAIGRIPNPAEQAAAAVELFGKSGADLAPLMAGGSAAIAEAQAEAQKLGLTFSRVDAAKVEQANDAWTKIGEAIGGAGNTIAITLAPALTIVFETIAEIIGQANIWFANMTGGADIVTTAIGVVAKAFGTVADVVHTVGLAFGAVQAIITVGLGVMVQDLARFTGGIEWLLNQIPGVKVEFGNFLKTFGEDLQRLGGEQWDKFQKDLAAPPPSVGIEKFFDGLKVKAGEFQGAATAAKKDWSALAEIQSEAAETKQPGSKETNPFAGAMERGSQEARSTILAFGRSAEDTQRETALNTKQQVAQQVKTNEQLATIAARLVSATPII